MWPLEPARADRRPGPVPPTGTAARQHQAGVFGSPPESGPTPASTPPLLPTRRRRMRVRCECSWFNSLDQKCGSAPSRSDGAGSGFRPRISGLTDRLWNAADVRQMSAGACWSPPAEMPGAGSRAAAVPQPAIARQAGIAPSHDGQHLSQSPLISAQPAELSAEAPPTAAAGCAPAASAADWNSTAPISSSNSSSERRSLTSAPDRTADI